MGLKGTLRTIPLPELLRLFSMNKSTGMLHLVHEGSQRSIYFQQGGLISAESSDPRDFLGHFLLSQGKITEDQLSQAMVVKQKTRKMLGKTLVDLGAIKEDEMDRLMALKCRELLFSMFFWEEADFEFFDNMPAPLPLQSGSLDVERIVQEGLQRCEEYRVLRRMYPSRGVCFEKIPAAKDEAAFTDQFVQKVYSLIDGKRTIREIILQTHTNEYHVFKCLHGLMRKGFIRVLDPNREPTEADQFGDLGGEILQLGKVKLNQRNFEEAINLFRYFVNRNPENIEAKALLASAEESLVRNIYEAFSPDSVPKLLKTPIQIVSEGRLTSEESFILSKINGLFDVKSILAITPLPEVEALRILKRLLDRKAISF